ncbi:TetR family transcriptional regulator [Thiothrix fructosivorans]|uniref:TetR family transcriptional regulator n=1 Tax=Thiothrix fructosivorans TaxID=111770 RepID=A0A8B0SF12_9GAMM|nr:TetR family transcriptional regulator [Thiothrix fructosivorans]MBO0614829.1 TetR family transcriptional regulator [Thiothrix fructosivorans]QTX09644.1 TetR family transcriptional regulator [Thiothrix fructosivorans]
MQIRATNPEDKEQRREAILDAAEQQWLAQPERMANVAEIAAAAGLAKGTVYLYFRSKEELFLAIHERHVENFFKSMITRAEQDTPMQMKDVFALTRQFLAATNAFLPIATQCHGMMERHIPLEVGYAFEERTYVRLNTAVTALQRHFPLVNQALMLQSYALILGLWQLMRPTPLKELMQERSLICACNNDYLFMLDTALNALWRGALTPETS